MKKTKRLINVLLGFAIMLCFMFTLNSKGYAVSLDWTFKIMVGSVEVTADSFYEASDYTVLPYYDDSNNGYYNHCTYPTVCDEAYDEASYIAFGPFTMNEVSGLVKWGNKKFSRYGTVNPVDDVANFYETNKNSFSGYQYYNIQGTSKYFLVIPKENIKPSVFVNSKNGYTVFQDKFSVTPGDVINLACIPNAGYELDTYYWYDKNGNERNIAGNTFTIPDDFSSSIFIDAKFTKLEERVLDSYRTRMIERIAELLQMNEAETNDFKLFISTLPNENEFLNSTKFMYDLIRPLYKEMYSADYENETAEKDSIEDYLKSGSMLTMSDEFLNTSASKLVYSKRIVGLLMLSYYSMFDEANDENIAAVSDGTMYGKFGDFIAGYNSSNITGMNSSAWEIIKLSISSMETISSFDQTDSIETSIEERYSPIWYLISELDSENIGLTPLDNNYYKNDIERYQLYIRNFLTCMEPSILSISQEDYFKYGELEKLIDEEVYRWAARDTLYADIAGSYFKTNSRKYAYRDAVTQKISEMETTLAGLSSDSEKEALKFEIIKEEIRLITREICDDKALMETLLFEGDPNHLNALFTGSPSSDYRTYISNLMTEIKDIKTAADSKTERTYESIYESSLYAKFIAVNDYSQSIASLAFSPSETATTFADTYASYYDGFRNTIKQIARDEKIIIEEIDGLYEYDYLDDVNFNVYYEKNGVKTRIPTIIEAVYKDPELENEVQTSLSETKVNGESHFFYKIKIDYGNMPNLFVIAVPNMEYCVYFDVVNETGTTFGKYYPNYLDTLYPDDIIWLDDDGFIVDVTVKKSMKINIEKVPELLYGQNVSEIENCTLTNVKSQIIFSKPDAKLGERLLVPYTIEAYKNTFDAQNKITDEVLERGNKYLMKTTLDISNVDTDDIFTQTKLDSSISTFNDALNAFEFDVCDIGIYENDTDSESTYVYQNLIDDKIIKIEVDTTGKKIYVYSYLPILEDTEIEEFKFDSSTKDSITFRVKGNNLNHSYELRLKKKEANGSNTDLGELSSTLNLVKLGYDYHLFEDDALITVTDVIPGEEQLVTYPLTGYLKRKLGFDSFPAGDYVIGWNVPLTTNDACGSEIPCSLSDVDFYDFTISYPSSSKTYKAKDESKTAEKISGSGKKGSKRTITPKEGRKVSSVVVRDKNGNKVDVTLNADGTYSFIQPASDVTVEVVYKNREIKLTIGSTEASVDGVRSNLDVTPVIRNDRTMLPIRFVAENLGAKVEWSEKRPDYVLITKGDIKIEITLGSDIAKVNGKEYKLDSVAFAENDRTYLPVRFVSENLNAIVEWNELRPMEVLIYER